MTEFFSFVLQLLVIAIVVTGLALLALGATAIVGLVAYRNKNHSLAIICFRVNTWLARKSFLPHYYLALALHQSGDMAAAVGEYQIALEVNPKRLEPYHQSAEAYLMLNQPEKSLEILQTLLNSDAVTLSVEQKTDLRHKISQLKTRLVS